MADLDAFARGSQLGQVLLNDLNPQVIFTAALHTEVMLIFVARVGAEVGSISLFHDDDGAVFDPSTSLFTGLRVSNSVQGVFDAAQCIGGGIHVSPGGSIGMQQLTLNGDVNVTVYGIVQSVAPGIA